MRIVVEVCFSFSFMRWLLERFGKVSCLFVFSRAGIWGIIVVGSCFVSCRISLEMPTEIVSFRYSSSLILEKCDPSCRTL